jgi:hypothetical protein
MDTQTFDYDDVFIITAIPDGLAVAQPRPLPVRHSVVATYTALGVQGRDAPELLKAAPYEAVCEDAGSPRPSC